MGLSYLFFLLVLFEGRMLQIQFKNKNSHCNIQTIFLRLRIFWMLFCLKLQDIMIVLETLLTHVNKTIYFQWYRGLWYKSQRRVSIVTMPVFKFLIGIRKEVAIFTSLLFCFHHTWQLLFVPSTRIKGYTNIINNRTQKLKWTLISLFLAHLFLF